jgi:hypothetical protein
MCSSNGNKINTKPRYRQARTATHLTMRLIMPAMLSGHSHKRKRKAAQTIGRLWVDKRFTLYLGITGSGSVWSCV